MQSLAAMSAEFCRCVHVRCFLLYCQSLLELLLLCLSPNLRVHVFRFNADQIRAGLSVSLLFFLLRDVTLSALFPFPCSPRILLICFYGCVCVCVSVAMLRFDEQ